MLYHIILACSACGAGASDVVEEQPVADQVLHRAVQLRLLYGDLSIISPITISGKNTLFDKYIARGVTHSSCYFGIQGLFL